MFSSTISYVFHYPSLFGFLGRLWNIPKWIFAHQLISIQLDFWSKTVRNKYSVKQSFSLTPLVGRRGYKLDLVTRMTCNILRFRESQLLNLLFATSQHLGVVGGVHPRRLTFWTWKWMVQMIFLFQAKNSQVPAVNLPGCRSSHDWSTYSAHNVTPPEIRCFS